MPLDKEILPQWRNMWGDVAVPQYVTLRPNSTIRPIAVKLLKLLVDSDLKEKYLVSLLERQRKVSAIDFILALLIWESQGITDYYSEGIPGLISFAPKATSSEFISRARRLLTTEDYGDPVWRLPPELKKQSEQAEKKMRKDFSKE